MEIGSGESLNGSASLESVASTGISKRVKTPDTLGVGFVIWELAFDVTTDVGHAVLPEIAAEAVKPVFPDAAAEAVLLAATAIVISVVLRTSVIVLLSDMVVAAMSAELEVVILVS